MATQFTKDLNVPSDDFDFANFVKDDGSIMTMEEVERIHIKRALDQNNWNRENTARLGISQKLYILKFLSII